MTDIIEPFDSYLKDLETMDISLENISHVTLINGAEFIAEIVPENRKKNQDIVFLYPIKVLKESFIDDLGIYNPQILMVEYNICSDQPFIPINPSSVSSIVSINEDTLKCYIETLKLYYFPEIFYETDVEQKAVSLKKEDNIIQFNKYHKKV